MTESQRGHQLVAPSDCPKCGYRNGFNGPLYREADWTAGYPAVMVWTCAMCGFEKVTKPLDEGEEAGK